MTTIPAAPAPQAGRRARTLHLSELLRRPLTDRGGETVGRLSDVIVRLRGAENPMVTGLVATVGGREVYVPIEQVSSLGGGAVKLTSAKLDLRSFERRDGEVLLRAWSKFEPLIGHTGSALLRGPFARIRRLKPAQIADLLEDASKEEETEILGQVHADPELEADVFEELDEDLATRLLGARTDTEIAEVLSRMRADDAADAIAELPQRRRQPVLDLLPPGQRTKVLTLMGFNPTSAGGLMGVDFLAVPADAQIREALAAVANSVSLQPEALTSVHALDEKGRLCGVAKLVSLVQSDPAARIRDVYDDDPVRIGADTDVVDVAVLMSDYNLITIPVVDERRKMIGVITVDDVLEVTLPDDWRRREAAQPPDAHRGDRQ